MNLYKYHESPEQLKFYALAEDKIPDVFWDKHKNNPEELKKREKELAKSARYAYLYASYILNGRFPEGEVAIAKDVYCAYWYVIDVLRKPWSESEATIAKDVRYAYGYARNVLKLPDAQANVWGGNSNEPV